MPLLKVGHFENQRFIRHSLDKRGSRLQADVRSLDSRLCGNDGYKTTYSMLV